MLVLVGREPVDRVEITSVSEVFAAQKSVHPARPFEWLSELLVRSVAAIAHGEGIVDPAQTAPAVG